MYTGEFKQAYAESMPVQHYVLKYKCGCTYQVQLASWREIPNAWYSDHDCSKCYTGPYGNVWD